MRSRGETIGPDTDIYLADTLNEMGLFLRLADVVVMGGSFAPAIGLPPSAGIIRWSRRGSASRRSRGRMRPIGRR